MYLEGFTPAFSRRQLDELNKAKKFIRLKKKLMSKKDFYRLYPFKLFEESNSILKTPNND